LRRVQTRADHARHGLVRLDREGRAMIADALQALTAYQQFIVYRLQPSTTRPGKTDKIPLSPHTCLPCNAHDSASWTDHGTAATVAATLGPGHGVGFVLTDADPFFCLDLDDCALPDGSGWSPAALALLARFPGACVEASQSGRGLHVWGQYAGAMPSHGCRNGSLGAELYTSRRFIALGLPGAVGDAGTDCTEALASVVSELFPPPAAVAAAQPAQLAAHAEDDDALIARALASRSAGSAFGNRASFSDLWTADDEALARQFPDTGGQRAYDASRADAALAQHLAFWTGKDAERMARLMRRSGLAREKWMDRPEYLDLTIQRAIAQQETTASPRAAGNWQIAPLAADADPDLSHDSLALELSRAGWSLDARYVPAWGCWYFWDGQRWSKDERLHHMTAIRDFLRAKAGMLMQWAASRAKDMPADDADKLLGAVKRKAADLRNAASRAAVELTARSNADLVAVPDQFDASPDLLGTPSGAVDLRTGQMRPAERGDFITRAVALDPAPAGTAAPLWSSFLARIFAGDAEMVAFIQRAAGYALTGHTREQKLLFLFGTGANGKSVFLNTLQWLLAEYGRRAPASLFLDSRNEQHPTDLASLRGARLVVSSELPPGKTWNEALIKDVTGGDPITARFMRADPFTYLPQFALMIAGNHQPTFRGIDEAIRRRVLLVPFTVTIPAGERDHSLPERLRAEGPAILRWCLDGAAEWYRQGLNPPASVEAASADYLDGEDMLAEFMGDCLTPATGAGERIASIYQRFQTWSVQRGLSSPWTQHALTRAISERGLPVRRKNDGRWLLDYQLKGWVVTP
jgi:P4 family phage/plasmid primase-like protien